MMICCQKPQFVIIIDLEVLQFLSSYLLSLLVSICSVASEGEQVSTQSFIKLVHGLESGGRGRWGRVNGGKE